jgi:RNA polymerase sigma-70 factor (ECF subfamily)
MIAFPHFDERASVGSVADHGAASVQSARRKQGAAEVDERASTILRAPVEIFIALYLKPAPQYLWLVLTALDRWFAAEILPHEAMLVRYLTRVWPNAAEVLDLRQDIYVRVYESARGVLPTSPKAFLFATARNLMTDRIRHSRVVFIDSTQDLDGLNVLIDEISPERRVNARQELRALALAFDSLSDKCRNVIWLRRVEGLSQRETAQRLGLNEGAVESQLGRGVRLLATAVFGTDDGVDPGHDRREAKNDSQHE